MNILRSPDPGPKKKSRHSALSPHGLDDLRREADNLVIRSLKKLDSNNNSQMIFDENSNDAFLNNSIINNNNNSNNGIDNISSTPGASQDDLNYGISELNNGSNLFRNKSKSNFRAAHLNSCEKENTINKSSIGVTSKASSRRRRLERCRYVSLSLSHTHTYIYRYIHT